MITQALDKSLQTESAGELEDKPVQQADGITQIILSRAKDPRSQGFCDHKTGTA